MTDFESGFEAGWKAAADTVWRNRNRTRAMVGYAPETQIEAMKRIYSGGWPAPPPAILPGAERSGSMVEGTIDVMLDSIDLYVVLPPASLDNSQEQA